VEEFDSLNHGRTVKVSMNNQSIEGYASVWCDILKTDSAEVLATYEQDYFSGMPAITVNKFGSGKVYYVGCDLDQNFITAMISSFSKEAAVNTLLPKPVPNVEVMKRVMDGREYLFVLNHGTEKVSIPVDGFDLISNNQLKGGLMLKPYDVAIVR
jgi:beta-galactosidase